MIPSATRPWFEEPGWERVARERGLGERETALVATFRRDGFVIVEDDRILDEIDTERIWTDLADGFAADGSGRVQDAWTTQPAVRTVATHPAVLDLLRTLYGREPVPFQTLNFLNGTEQRTHSDTIHFSSLPSGFMCGVWVALEDVTLKQGPLHYFPGSQALPEFDYEDLGIAPVEGEPNWGNPNTAPAYLQYEERIARIAGENGFRKQELALRRGSFLVWSANLLHGGSPREDRTLTRKSQVTHYFFRDAVPFTPMFSRRSEGAFHVRTVRDIATGAYLVPTVDGVPVVFPRVDDVRRRIRRIAPWQTVVTTPLMAAGKLPSSPAEALAATVAGLRRRARRLVSRSRSS